MKAVHRTILLAGSAIAMLSLSAGASAQTAAAPTATNNDKGADEIVVTANKRSENANKVGLSIAVISGEQLAERKITSLSDIASAVPGLTYAPSTANTPIFTLRGVGFNESSLGVYPAVSVYIDQIPLPFPVLGAHSAFDLERVEVLKGPQGTLFGQNSTGGAINFIAAKPTKTLQAGGDISYGRFNEIDGNAYISGPLSNTLGFRLAGTGEHMDPWQYSVSRPNDKLGAISYAAGRLLLDWNPVSAARFELNINGYHDTSEPQAQQAVLINPQQPKAAAGQLSTEVSQKFSNGNARSADWVDQFADPATAANVSPGGVASGAEQLGSFRPFSDRKFYQVALRADFDILPNVTLTSMTSYDHFEQTQATNGDGLPIVTFDLQRDDGYIHSFNQELRLANTGNSPLRWVIGGNYEKTTTSENQLLRYFDNSNYTAGNLFINASGVVNDQSIRNLAAFANAEFQLSEKFKLIGGARYTDSRNSANECSYSIPGGNTDKLFNVLGGYSGQPFTPLTATSGCYTLNALTIAVPNGVTVQSPYGPGPFGIPSVPFVAVLHQHNISWKAGVDYQIDPHTLLYGLVSRGYKAGSFPSLAAALYTGLLPVTQESVTAYEVGIKAQSVDHRFAVNAAGFYYDYANKQVRGKLADPIFGDLDALVNVPKSRIWGLEADVSARLIEGLTISGSATYLNSRVKTYTGVNVLGQPNQNFAGEPLPFTPKFAGQINLDYRMQMENGGTPFFGITVHGQTDSDAVFGASTQQFSTAGIIVTSPTKTVGFPAVAAAGVTQPYVNNGYATVDLRLGYESPAGWKVMVWGKNVLNKYYWTNVVPSNDSAGRLAAMPVSYGVTLGFKFK